MKISIISDVHIQVNDDNRDQLLERFLKHPDVINSDYIVLLGDIFDVLAGNKKGYIDMFPNFFNNLIDCAKNGKKILYFEGNHDIHLKNFFQIINSAHKLNPPIEYIKKNKVIDFNGKKIYLSHGDDIEDDNGMYQSWRNILDSAIFKIFIFLIPIYIIKKIGEGLSKSSKKQSGLHYNENLNRIKFRRAAKKMAMNGFDFIISGHSHVQDIFKFTFNGNEYIYGNNGFAPFQQSFLLFDSGEMKIVKLS